MQRLTGSGLRPAILFSILVMGLFGASSASAQTITIANRSVFNWGGTPVSVAIYALSWNGDIVTSKPSGNGTMDAGDWLTPKSGMSNFQVRATASTCNGPAVGVWIQLGVTGPGWSIQTSGGSSASCVVSIEIAAIANPSVPLGTATISLGASP